VLRCVCGNAPPFLSAAIVIFNQGPKHRRRAGFYLRGAIGFPRREGPCVISDIFCRDAQAVILYLPLSQKHSRRSPPPRRALALRAGRASQPAPWREIRPVWARRVLRSDASFSLSKIDPTRLLVTDPQLLTQACERRGPHEAMVSGRSGLSIHR